MSDTDIDCADISFSIEGLDPVRVHRQLYPGDTLPFKLKNLSFELVVERLNIQTIIEMTVKEGADPAAIISRVDAFIQGFNDCSLKKDRVDGVVHNWKTQVERDKVTYDIDTGYAGPALLKKLLPFLSDMGDFKRVALV
jgi:hypothetical protein